MDRYAVFGNPVEHSLSPLIHGLFAERTGQSIEYGKIHVPLNEFSQAVLRFREAGGRGLNITVPFKEQAYRLSTHCSLRAEGAQAVNTLKFVENGGAEGDNTDGVGLLRDLSMHQALGLEGSRILLIGAGGAARGVIFPLLQAKPAQLVIANRNAQRASNLHACYFENPTLMDGHENRFSTAAIDHGVDRPYDIVINATSASLTKQPLGLHPSVFGPDTLAYDMVYGAEETTFMRQAIAAGCGRAADGLGMLVEQAAEAFLIWRGIRPPTEEVLRIVRTSLVH